MDILAVFSYFICLYKAIKLVKQEWLWLSRQIRPNMKNGNATKLEIFQVLFSKILWFIFVCISKCLLEWSAYLYAEVDELLNATIYIKRYLLRVVVYEWDISNLIECAILVSNLKF